MSQRRRSVDGGGTTGCTLPAVCLVVDVTVVSICSPSPSSNLRPSATTPIRVLRHVDGADLDDTPSSCLSQRSHDRRCTFLPAGQLSPHPRPDAHSAGLSCSRSAATARVRWLLLEVQAAGRDDVEVITMSKHHRNTRKRDTDRARIRRSGSNCHICGGPIDYALPWMDPMAFVVDHVVPLARGGSDDLDNKRAAHRSCNSTKRARLVAPIVRRSGSLD